MQLADRFFMIAKGVFISSSSAIAFFWTTRLASGFTSQKKQAFASLLCFFDRAGTEPLYHPAISFSGTALQAVRLSPDIPIAILPWAKAIYFPRQESSFPNRFFPFNCVVSKLCFPNPFYQENHDSSSFVTVSYKIRRNLRACFPRCKVPAPAPKRSPRFPPRCKAKVIPNQSGFSPLLKAFVWKARWNGSW